MSSHSSACTHVGSLGAQRQLASTVGLPRAGSVWTFPAPSRSTGWPAAARSTSTAQKPPNAYPSRCLCTSAKDPKMISSRAPLKESSLLLLVENASAASQSKAELYTGVAVSNSSTPELEISPMRSEEHTPELQSQ